MLGEKHPDKNEIISLAKNFNPHKDTKDTNKETFAWLELYTYDVAKLVHECILDKKPDKDFNVHLLTPLKESLQQQLTIRDESDEFGRYAEVDMTNFMNHRGLI